MTGPFTTVVLSGFLAASPGGFTFEGREASARTEQPDGFFIQGPLPFTDLAESGSGSAALDVEDRVSDSGATYGDAGSLSASFRLGGTEYRVELTQVGFPPRQAWKQAPSGVLPRPPPHMIQGGVLLDVPLYGDTGLGWMAMTRTHAAAALWGVGSVWRNGQLLTDTAFVHAAALDAGAYADDDTHRLLRQARYGDSELVVLVWNLPPDQEPRGFLQFVYEDVGISVGGASLPSQPYVENTASPPWSLSQLQPVPPTAIIGAPPTVSPSPNEAGVGGSGVTSDTLTPVPFGASVTQTAQTPGTVEAVTPGTVVVSDVPNPPLNISGSLPGTPAPGSLAATSGEVTPGAAAPGTTTDVGPAARAFAQPGGVNSTGLFFVQPVPSASFEGFQGTTQVSPGIIATVPPLNADPATPPAALLGAPAPLNAAAAPALPTSPTPLNATPATSLPATPTPGNAAPVAPTATPPATAPGATPGGTGVAPSI